ncbi:MAG: biopolymer transporter ExbD [Flavobacteriales bacterium]|nr:biopolymer transporter ExbD [Flavobacteriales bacterium]
MDLGTRNQVSANAGMSSMTDLVFLLLIFFIILSTRVVNGEQVDLPSTNADPAPLPPVTLTITKDLRYQIDGKDVAKEDIPRRLQAYYYDKSDNQRSVLLNADKDVPFGETIEVMDMAQELGLDIAVATRDK